MTTCADESGIIGRTQCGELSDRKLFGGGGGRQLPDAPPSWLKRFFIGLKQRMVAKLRGLRDRSIDEFCRLLAQFEL